MSNTEYLRQFKSNVEVIDVDGGKKGNNSKIENGIHKETGIDLDTAKDAQKKRPPGKQNGNNWNVC